MRPSDAIAVIFRKWTASIDEPLEAKGCVGLWIHLGLLTIQLTISETRRQHLLPKRVRKLKIMAVLPMRSTGAERSFSCIRRIHTWLHNTMTTERLSNLAIITMHANAVTIDRSVVCEKIVALHTLDEWRRLHFWPTRSERYFNKLLFLLFCGVYSVTVSKSSFPSRYGLGQT